MEYEDYQRLGIGSRRVSLVEYRADEDGLPSLASLRAAIRPLAPDNWRRPADRAAKLLKKSKSASTNRLNLLLHREKWILVSEDKAALEAVSEAMSTGVADLADIALCCVPLEASGRPCPGTVPEGDQEGLGGILVWSYARCTRCEACADVCPADCLTMSSGRLGYDRSACIHCFQCVEVCPQKCLWPDAGAEWICPSVEGLEKWLATLSLGFKQRYRHGSPAEYLQSPELNATLEAELAGGSKTSTPQTKKLAILGLAITTMQEHAAALLLDGKIAGYIEEERFRRRKHYGWRPPGKHGLTLCNDLSLGLEEAFCWKSVRKLCEMSGLGLEDIDYIALNGIPARYRRSYSLDDPSRPPKILRSDKLVFVPHHLAHAASAYHLSGFKDAAVLTVDGRGDRETAAFYKATSDGELVQLFDILCKEDSSIGGVYETITRILGFGQFGQGSTMALASFGKPTYDMQPYRSVNRHDRHRIHEWQALEAFEKLGGPGLSDLSDQRTNLAASVQQALEESVIRLLEEGYALENFRNLCLAGGVALNCRMNQRIRKEFSPQGMFVQPAAHDGGTALGAALEAHRLITGDNPGCGVMEHAYLGPDYSNEGIEKALKRFGLTYEKSPDVARDAAQLIADGKLVCWFQGKLEAGPRALGSRSILADPRRADLKERLNQIKGRQPWRPFAPSILAGREAEYFEAAFHTPFMLFTFEVKAEVRKNIPLVLHVDSTTRPQSVAEEVNPRYHALIRHFESHSGIPLVVNTSFNTAHEPIVCSPVDALASFLMLQADYLAIGDYLVSR
jgi:predicted NodU family carbamoyl transferase/ferredoxin